MYCSLLYEVNSKLYVNCYSYCGGKALSVILSYITKQNNFVAVKMEEIDGERI